MKDELKKVVEGAQKQLVQKFEDQKRIDDAHMKNRITRDDLDQVLLPYLRVRLDTRCVGVLRL